MSVISVRLNKEAETRLRQEAKAQGLRFSDFLRKRLTGEQQEPVEAAREKSVETARAESDDTVLSALRQIADFLCRMEKEQSEKGYLLQLMMCNFTLLLMPNAKEKIQNSWRSSIRGAKDHTAKQEGESS